jgi:ABC-type multidrug transport system fused ATPase/permease subunit
METVRDADRILVVEGGRVVAEGTFSTLVQGSSLFRALTEHMTEVAA